MSVIKIFALISCLIFFVTMTVASVRASQTVPWGVERIGARLLWDKNRDRSVVEVLTDVSHGAANG